MKKVIFLAVVLTLTKTFSYSTTWNEPWQDSIIIKSDYFVYGKIVECDKKNFKLKVIRAYGNEILKPEKSIVIESYFDLHCSSWSSAGAYELWFSTYLEKGLEVYLFIKKNKKGNFSLPTPTSGYAPVVKGNVVATYRHSYHRAIVTPEIYEKTMLAIFNHYHQIEYDKESITTFIEEQLSKKPASFNDDEINTFFLQHVAMESLFHLQLQSKYELLIPFLHDTSNIHNQISAARALVAFNTNACKQELLKMIKDTSVIDFLKLMCVMSLARLLPLELKEEIALIAENASDEYVSFGGDLMDPRIGTMLPSVKHALQELLLKI